MSSLWLVLSAGRKRCWREPRDVLYGRLFCNEEVQKCGKEWGEIVGEGGGRGGRVRLSSDLDCKTGGRLRNWSKLRLPSGCVPNGSDFESGRGNRNLFRLAGASAWARLRLRSYRTGSKPSKLQHLDIGSIPVGNTGESWERWDPVLLTS